jgi:DNA transformation protein
MANESIPIEQLRNIGPTIARRLQEVGIRTANDLRSVGAVAAYQRICATYPGTTIPVCYYLYSLEGALRGQHWDALRPKIKRDLLSQVAEGLKKRRAKRRTSGCSGP